MITRAPPGATPEAVLPLRAAPARQRVVVVLIAAGVATLATVFAALPAPVLVTATAAWCLVVTWCASPGASAIGLTILCAGVKAMTVWVILMMIFNPALAIGATNGLYWIPLGLLNMGSGLWFLHLIQRPAR